MTASGSNGHSDGRSNGHTAPGMAKARLQWLRRSAVWILAAVGAAAGLGAGVGLAASIDSGYEATGTAFVAFDFSAEELDPFSGSQFVTQRIDSYAQLGESPEVLRSAANDVPGRTQADLTDQVDVSAVPGTVLVRVTARDADSLTAKQIANSVMTHLNTEVGNIESGAADAASPIGLVPIQPPISGVAPSTRTTVLASLAGLAIGALAGAGAGWLVSRRRGGGKRRAGSPVRKAPARPARDIDRRGVVSAGAEPELSKR